MLCQWSLSHKAQIDFQTKYIQDLMPKVTDKVTSENSVVDQLGMYCAIG